MYKFVVQRLNEKKKKSVEKNENEVDLELPRKVESERRKKNIINYKTTF